MSFTLVCISTHRLIIPYFVYLIMSSLAPWILQLSIALYAVDLRASSGHGKNQSIVVQFTRPGKVLMRLLKLSPTGEKQRARWRFSLHSYTK